MSESGSDARFLWLARTTADMLAPGDLELQHGLERWMLAILSWLAYLIGRARQ